MTKHKLNYLRMFAAGSLQRTQCWTTQQNNKLKLPRQPRTDCIFEFISRNGRQKDKRHLAHEARAPALLFIVRSRRHGVSVHEQISKFLPQLLFGLHGGSVNCALEETTEPLFAFALFGENEKACLNHVGKSTGSGKTKLFARCSLRLLQQPSHVSPFVTNDDIKGVLT
jgi:hypothetical protein